MWTTSTEISNEIFNPLKTWVEKSNGNWNILLGGGFLLLVIGFILVLGFTKKIGKGDERTNKINLKSAYVLLIVVVLCDVFFPKEYLWQIFFLFKYSFAFIASGIYLAFQYRKDFK